jgi:hypothetical protein
MFHSLPHDKHTFVHRITIHGHWQRKNSQLMNITPSRLHHKLEVAQLVKKLHAFYGPEDPFTMLTRFRRLARP